MALMSIAPYKFIVPQYTSSPMLLSIGRDSPVMIDWSIDDVPSTISPSTGITSPGRILSLSSRETSSIDTMVSLPSSDTLLAVCGVKSMRFFNPFLALSTVQSSKSAPSAMIHATSPAAKSSPIRSEATIAMVIRSADDTHFSLMSLMSARYTRGIPLIITAPHDGSSHIGMLM